MCKLKKSSFQLQLSLTASDCSVQTLLKAKQKRGQHSFKMLSMSVGISFSGLFHCMLDYFAGSVVLVLSQLISQDRASDLFKTRSLDSKKLLREVLPRKRIELASSEMGLDSEFKNFKEASSSSKHATTSNQSRLKIGVLADSIRNQEHLLLTFRRPSSSSKQALYQSGEITSHPRKKACSNFNKGKVVLQASEAEDLNARLEILEEESEIMKEAFLETVVERKKLINEICQLFETLHYTICDKDKEYGQTSNLMYLETRTGFGDENNGKEKIIIALNPRHNPAGSSSHH